MTTINLQTKYSIHRLMDALLRPCRLDAFASIPRQIRLAAGRGDMTCQICKGPLPFKLDDGGEFFETVEFLPELGKHHFQNYLALCPNHSAMYRHANGSKEIICEMVGRLAGNELDVILAQQNMTIYLSAIHIVDIKAVLGAEEKLSSEADDQSAA